MVPCVTGAIQMRVMPSAFAVTLISGTHRRGRRRGAGAKDDTEIAVDGIIVARNVNSQAHVRRAGKTIGFDSSKTDLSSMDSERLIYKKCDT